jgi:hypothetical protein
MVDKQLRLQQYYIFALIARRGEKKLLSCAVDILFYFSITGKSCSYSPNEAAWNQIVLSEVLILSKVEKTIFRPSTKA